MSPQSLIDTFNQTLVNPLLALLFAVGLVIFLWGLVEFLWNLSRGSHDADKGKQHMLWGLVGMFVMSSAFAIVRLLASIVGKQLPY